MAQDTTIPPGAGTTTSSTTGGASRSSSDESGNSFSGSASYSRPSSETGSFQQDEHESGYRSSGRAVVVSDRNFSRPSTATVVGAALAGAVAGAAVPFLLAGRSSGGQRRNSENAEVEASVTINRPAREIYDFWRDFTNLPQFMDNIKSVEKLGEKRSHWVIKAPAGTSVEFDSFVTEDVPGKVIAWQSEEGATVPNRGRVEFNDQGGGSTLVRTTISYDPPAGAAGRLVAKLFQREPAIQAREDLARLRDLLNSRGAR